MNVLLNARANDELGLVVFNVFDVTTPLTPSKSLMKGEIFLISL